MIISVRCLVATGDAIVIEGNTWRDTYWGVDLKTGEGENHLGKILMRVRSELAQTHFNQNHVEELE